MEHVSYILIKVLKRNVKELAREAARTCSIDFQFGFNKEMEWMGRNWPKEFHEHCPLIFNRDLMRKLEGIVP